MQPLTTLADCFGPGAVFNPRVPYAGQHFVAGAQPETEDFFTGTFLTIAGDTTILCHASALRPEGLALFEEAGLPVSPAKAVYQDAREYRTLLEDLARTGRRLAFQHVHPVDQASPDLYAIPRDTLAFLNSKASLNELVPPEHAPQRRLLSPATARTLEPSVEHPAVLKGVTDLSTGGGGGVAIARSREEAELACDRLSFGEAIIVEDFLPFTGTFCLNYAADQHGVRYLGCAEQITGENGRYLGNWFDSEAPGPEAGIEAGMEIMRRAAAMGYRGIAGFDMGLLPDDSLIVFDLNFRLCGSTAGILWQPALRETRGPFHARIATFRGTRGFREMCQVASTAVRTGFLIPFGTFDPAPGPNRGITPLLRAMILGKDREEVEDRFRYLIGSGLAA